MGIEIVKESRFMVESAESELDYWKNPEGVPIPVDELDFLLTPDHVEAAIVRDLGAEVLRYQEEHKGTPNEITKAVAITMGGLLPASYLDDVLQVNGKSIEFGLIGVSKYPDGPESGNIMVPNITHPLDIDVKGHTVLLVDDLTDTGDSLNFTKGELKEEGAKQVLTFVTYAKPAALEVITPDFFFGVLDQDTWIITPRELIETMRKRVPHWQHEHKRLFDEELNYDMCSEWLINSLGYPEYVVDNFLPMAWQ